MDVYFFVFALIFLLIFLAGLGFAVYGLLCFLRNRKSSSELYDGENEEGTCLPDSPSEKPGLIADTVAAASAEHKSAVSSAASMKPARTGSKPRRLSYFTSGQGIDFGNSLMLRSFVIAGITLCLLIPLAFVSEIVDERSYLHSSAISDIADKWGKSQTISGPALIIPYEVWTYVSEKVTNENGKVEEVRRRVTHTEYKAVLPKKVDFEANLSPQTRHRGIYEYVVYTTPVSIQGVFQLPSREVFPENLVRIWWEKAYFSLGVSDLKAITKTEPLIWNTTEASPFEPGTDAGSLLGAGFHSRVPVDSNVQEHSFSMTLSLNGSGGIFFTPVGETTEIRVKGAWGAPSFGGAVLPKSHSISADSFEAFWSIPHLSRTYPQVGDLRSFDSRQGSSQITTFSAGVHLYEMVPLYRMVTRAVKYGILFIGLTFIALLSFELATQTRLHLLQYGLVGVAMSLFYLVLLSLAEHTSFGLAFIASSFISLAMNGLYITAAMRSTGKGLLITGLLSGLYAVLYALLQMEDYALLLGTLLVLIVVGVLMYLTRHLPVGIPAEKR